MNKQRNLKPLAIAFGAALTAGAAAIPVANADQNPFGMTNLTDQVVAGKEKGEGKCGEGKCGEGKCGK